MNVLAFASYPVEAAATRYRLHQFISPLAERGISLTIKPFLDSKQFASLYDRRALASIGPGLVKSALLRLGDALASRRADVVLIQREAMIFGPPLVEWLSSRLAGRPLVLDLDDATYVPYTSPTYGQLGQKLKWFSKTDDLIRWAAVVTCGNRAIAEYAESKGARTSIIPTVVDTDVFRPAKRAAGDKLVLGWVGTHSTFPYLKTIFPALQNLATTHDFKLRIVGAGSHDTVVPGVDVESLNWKLDREVADFQSFDIGLYPIDSKLHDEKWAAGKSGFKAIQYMAVGIPYVATPIGAITDIGRPGETYFQATTATEWQHALGELISNSKLREDMGAAGRAHVVNNYSLPAQADKLATALRGAAKKGEAG
ncbi:MAG TPA: glycosyltransferase family 4 protein [Pyrinomonadaceae bacterium]|nr:glycosyltransferase family 4 protein [Pyrinomonadaceae bacterium]